MKHLFIAAIILLCGYALSWTIIVGALWLISLCFGWQFNIAVATGIWLILCLWKLLTYKGKKEG